MCAGPVHCKETGVFRTEHHLTTGVTMCQKLLLKRQCFPNVNAQGSPEGRSENADSESVGLGCGLQCGISNEKDQDMPPPNVPFWHKNYLELETVEFLKSLICLKAEPPKRTRLV